MYGTRNGRPYTKVLADACADSPRARISHRRGFSAIDRLPTCGQHAYMLDASGDSSTTATNSRMLDSGHQLGGRRHGVGQTLPTGQLRHRPLRIEPLKEVAAMLVEALADLLATSTGAVGRGEQALPEQVLGVRDGLHLVRLRQSQPGSPVRIAGDPSDRRLVQQQARPRSYGPESRARPGHWPPRRS